MSLLEVDKVISGYGQTEILHGVSITVEQGEIVTIIGPNGSGKSTLLKTIMGLVTLTNGRVSFNEKNITQLAPENVVREGICYVPQSSNVFPSLNVQENLEMGAFIRTDDFSHRIDEIYDMFPYLKSRRKERAGRLSGGQRQMLALARALMLDPVLLLLDEPSAGLAPNMVQLVLQKVIEINSIGVAILLVEQNAREALKLSSRGYVLASAQNQLQDTGEHLLDNPEIARLYLGG